MSMLSSLAKGLAVAAMLSGPAQAAIVNIDFHIEGDASDWPWIGRSFLVGDLEGTLYGLDENLAGQVPTALEFTSDVSALGLGSTFVSSFDYVIGGIDLSGGIVTFADILINFSDALVGPLQFRLNHESRNVLHWNGGSSPVAGFGNGDGFSGATYDGVAAIPLPAGLPLMLTSLVGLGLLVKRKKSD